MDIFEGPLLCAMTLFWILTLCLQNYVALGKLLILQKASFGSGVMVGIW